MKTTLQTANPLPQETRERVTDTLNGLLAELTDLHSQCKYAHWNVRGRLFYSMHKLFDKLAKTVLQHIDPVAERITALGGIAEGTIRMAADRSSLPEFVSDFGEELGFLYSLMDRFAHCGTLLSRAIDEAGEFHDQGTTDLLSDVSRDLEQGLWFLEAHTR